MDPAPYSVHGGRTCSVRHSHGSPVDPICTQQPLGGPGLSLRSRVCGLALTGGVRKSGQRLSLLTLLAWHVFDMGDV